MVKFYRCAHCGNIIEKVVDKGVPVLCCGEKMGEIVPNTVEAALEKHIPEVAINGNLVEVVVGSTIHPMTEAHLIQWIVLETNRGVYRVNLTAEDAPKASFALQEGEKAIEVYAYCNLHGLWSKKI